jgi:hypothetical protein
VPSARVAVRAAQRLGNSRIDDTQFLQLLEVTPIAAAASAACSDDFQMMLAQPSGEITK